MAGYLYGICVRQSSQQSSSSLTPAWARGWWLGGNVCNVKIIVFLQNDYESIRGSKNKNAIFNIFICLFVVANLRNGWTELNGTFTGK